ncbi:hypothetical protein ABH991_000334 [Bradyrhizobium ottawaense]
MSIFMVVVLAAPVRAEEAEDLTLPDAEADVVDGHEAVEPSGQVVGLDRDLVMVLGARRDDDIGVVAAIRVGQETNEGLVERIRAGLPLELGRRSGRQHAAGIHRDQEVELRGLFHVGGRDDHAHAGPAIADRGDQFPELAARQRINAGGRLVQDQEFGIVDQGAAQADLLLHAAGEFCRRPVGEGREPGVAQQAGDPPVPLGLVVSEQAAEEVDVLEHRQCRIQILAEPLRHIGDVGAHVAAMARACHIAAEHVDASVLDRAGSGDQRQQARFADAVGADQSDHAAGRQVERDGIERPGLAIAQAHAFQMHHAAGGSRCIGCGSRAHLVSLILRLSGHCAAGSSCT